MKKWQNLYNIDFKQNQFKFSQQKHDIYYLGID